MDYDQLISDFARNKEYDLLFLRLVPKDWNHLLEQAESKKPWELSFFKGMNRGYNFFHFMSAVGEKSVYLCVEKDSDTSTIFMQKKRKENMV